VALAGAPPIAVQAVLAFGAAALVYLISEELLTEAHRGPEPKAAALLVFAGFLSVLAITLFTERH
jgi:ZIP family zinc transporter